MTATTTIRPAEDDVSSERRARILDAAERCFARAGFHRTTMQDIAAEAGMSPGNLYRYFPSKDAMVAGLAERDRADMARDFAQLEAAENFVPAFAALGRKHFAEEPRERTVLCLEIWAEATRNPAFAAISGEFEREVVGRMAVLIAKAQERGSVDAGVDPETVARLISTIANGLFVRRAVAPGFDPEREVPAAIAVIGAMLQGGIALPAPPSTKVS